MLLKIFKVIYLDFNTIYITQQTDTYYWIRTKNNLPPGWTQRVRNRHSAEIPNSPISAFTDG